MKPSFSEVDDAVKSAAEHARLPERPACGFDGEAWVWVWRSMENPLGETPASEVRLRILPDADGFGTEVEVLAAAWMAADPDLTAGRTLFAGKVTAEELKRKEFVTRLGRSLAEAWTWTRDAAQRLPSLAKQTRQRRRAALDGLRRIVTDPANDR